MLNEETTSQLENVMEHMSLWETSHIQAFNYFDSSVMLWTSQFCHHLLPGHLYTLLCLAAMKIFQHLEYPLQYSFWIRHEAHHHFSLLNYYVRVGSVSLSTCKHIHFDLDVYLSEAYSGQMVHTFHFTICHIFTSLFYRHS